MDPLFFELHKGLPHEAPSSRADTLRALALTGLSGPLRVLDAIHGPSHPVLAGTAEEIAVRREHAADYGYGVFIVA